MSRADEFLAKSVQLWVEAEAAPDPKRRADLEWLANSYRLLAEHAREESNIVDLIRHPSAEQQQPQQAQQSKLEPEE